MLRRLKDSPEVGVKIPKKTEVILSVPLSELQNAWYMRILTGCDELLHGEVGNTSALVQKQTEKQKKDNISAVRNMLMELRKVSEATFADFSCTHLYSAPSILI